MTPRTELLASIPLIVYMAFVGPRLYRKSGSVPKFVESWSRSVQLAFVWGVVAFFFVILIPAVCVLIVETLGPQSCPGYPTDPWRCSTAARLILIYTMWLIAVPAGCIGASALARIIEAQNESGRYDA